MVGLLLALLLGGVSIETGSGETAAAIGEAVLVLHTYEARIRLNGKVSTTRLRCWSSEEAGSAAVSQGDGS
jgi:hypothetical protein